jgi:hypothetical protein
MIVLQFISPLACGLLFFILIFGQGPVTGKICCFGSQNRCDCTARCLRCFRLWSMKMKSSAF